MHPGQINISLLSTTGREPANGWHSFRLQGRLFRLGVVFFTLPVPPIGHIVPSTTLPAPSTGQFVATPRSTARIRPNAASIRRRSEPIRTYTERSRPRPPTYLTRLLTWSNTSGGLSDTAESATCSERRKLRPNGSFK